MTCRAKLIKIIYIPGTLTISRPYSGGSGGSSNSGSGSGRSNRLPTTEEILKELEREDLSGIRLELKTPEEKDFVLKAEVIKKAKEYHKDIVVEVKGSDDKVLYSWTFDKTELSNSDKEIQDVNLSLKVSKAPEDAGYWGEQKEDEDAVALVIDFAHEGILPAQARVRIYVGDQEGITPGTRVYLYHNNEQTGKLETVPYGYHVIVDEEGYITINILQCSDYVILTKEADAGRYVSLRNQIKVNITNVYLYMSEGKTRSRIQVKLPVTLEWVGSLDDPTRQSAMGGVTVSFTSSDDKIATVDSEGNITAKAPGKAIITATITLYSKKIKKVDIVVIVKE